MSIFSHRAEQWRASYQDDEGVMTIAWTMISSCLECRMDTTFTIIKDVEWRTTPGRAPDKIGMLLIKGNPDVIAQDRFSMISGPPGTFEVIANPDRPTGYGGVTHHLECQVREVATGLLSTDLSNA